MLTRYNATQVYNIIKERYDKLLGYSETSYRDPGNPMNQIPYYLHNNKDDHLVMITAVSHDGGRDSYEATSAAPLEDTLTKVKENLDKVENGKVLIPIAQVNKYFFGLFKRAHFTYLEVTKREDKLSCHHYDSKGWLSKLYSLSSITDSLSQIFGAKTEFQSSYMGHQGIFDDTNCGRFVLSYVDQSFTNNKSPEMIRNPQTENSFQELDKVLSVKTAEANQEIQQEDQMIQKDKSIAIEDDFVDLENQVNEDKKSTFVDKEKAKQNQFNSEVGINK